MENNISTLILFKLIYENEDGQFYDMGDRIACLVFKSKGNSITTQLRRFIYEVFDDYMKDFDALVIGNEGKNFSAGASLEAIKKIIDERDFDAAVDRVKIFQDLTEKIKFYEKPVVSAPFRMTLGGGMEIALYSHKRIADKVLYAGLVEIGVGLLPGGGGIKETLLAISKMDELKQIEELLIAFDKLILKKVSKDAEDAKNLRYLNLDDRIISEGENLLLEAKKECLYLLNNNWKKSVEEDKIKLLGKKGYEILLNRAQELLKSGRISQYDLYIAKKIADVMTGIAEEGEYVSEKELLKREREAFVDLMKQKETYDRITYFLNTGKLLRN